MKIRVIEDGDKQGQKVQSACRVTFVEGHEGERFVCDGDGTVCEIGISENALSRQQWMHLMRRTVQFLRKQRVKSALIAWSDIVRDDMEASECARLVAENLHMAHYTFRRYKKEPKGGWGDVEEVIVIVPKEARRSIAHGMRCGTLVAQQVNFCRDLSNTPGGDMTPSLFAQKVRAAIKGTHIRMRVLMPKQMQAKKMGGVLAVGRGSTHTPRFIILEYMGAAKNSKPYVLVGKGVTFDSGGIDVKPYPHATEMMMDMSGGAAAIVTVIAAAKLGIKKNVVALVPAVENMISGSSFRPGDILTMMDKTTVEVRNTDAEGRLILADALTYAQKYYAPKVIVDVATLTGAALVALGQQASALCTQDEELAAQLFALGEEVGDRVWPLPLWDEYDAMLKSSVADISNMSAPGTDRYAGTITAAAFLKHFVHDVPWAHIDMAPRMTSAKGDALASGAAGAPVRLLVRFLESL